MSEADDALEIGGRDDGAGRVRRRIEDDGLGARRDGLLDGVGSDAEVFGLVGFEIDDLAAAVLDDVLVGDPVGDGQDDFVSVIDEHLEGIEKRELAAGSEDRFVGRVVGAEVAGVALDDGFAHLGDAGDDGVAREVLVDGLDGGVLDVARRGEVGLAGSEVDQLGALCAQSGGFRGDGHGGGDFDASDAIGENFGSSGCSRHGDSIFSDFGGAVGREMVEHRKTRMQWPSAEVPEPGIGLSEASEGFRIQGVSKTGSVKDGTPSSLAHDQDTGRRWHRRAGMGLCRRSGDRIHSWLLAEPSVLEKAS